MTNAGTTPGSVPLSGDVRLSDAVSALVALGFKQPEALTAARAAIALLGTSAPVEQIVRACLKRPA